MQAYGNPDVTYDWWAGNARLANNSGKFLAAHIGQIGLMAFWAGAITLFELSRYSADLPLGEQGLICLPQLARLGWGVGDEGVIVDTYAFFVVGVIHLIGSAVYGAGAFYHTLKGPSDLGDSSTARTPRFEFEWDNPKKTGFILGHHLLFLGTACLLFVYWASNYGIYDPAIGQVRTVQPGLSPLTMFKYGWALPGYNPFLVDSLEDVMSGHLFVAILEISGGVFHIIVGPSKWATKLFIQSGEALLSYALAGLAIMGFNAAYFCAVNDTVFPTVFFGPLLEAKLGVSPYFADTINLPLDQHTARFWISNFHFFLAFMMLQGHLWHAMRAIGFDFKRVTSALESMSADPSGSSAKPTASAAKASDA